MKYAIPAVLAAAALFLTPAILRANRGAENGSVAAQTCGVAAQACSAAAKSYAISAQVKAAACPASAAACGTAQTTHPISATVASEGCSEVKAAACPASAAACGTAQTTHPISATVASEGCSEVKAAACSTSATACSTAQTTHPISATVASEACSAVKGTCCQTSGEACCAEGKSVKLTKAEFEVSGLGGAGCESKLTKALMTVEGVGEAQACSTSKQVKVAYDAKRTKEKAVVAAIVKAGYEVNSETVELKVNGMECGACSTTVGKSLAALEGVKEQKVCHAGNNAVVKFDPNLVSRDQLVAAIDKTGFTVAE